MKEIVNREVRRGAGESGTVSDADIEIALKMEKKGTPIPDSLKSHVEAYKAKNAGGGTPTPKPKPKSGKDEDEEEEQEPESGADDDEEEEEDSEDDSESADDEEENDEDESDSEDDDEDEDDEEGDPGRKKNKKPKSGSDPSERPVRTVPISKFQAVKKKGKERLDAALAEVEGLKGTIAELQKSKTKETEEQFQARLKAAAEEIGMNPEDLGKLASFMKKELAIPEGLMKKLEAAGSESPAPTKSKEEQKKEFWNRQFEKFDADFEARLKLPGVDSEMAEHKKAIRDLYFTDGHTHESIYEIWNLHVKPNLTRKKKGVDSPGNGPGAGNELNWEEIAKDPEKIRALTVEQKAKFTEYMGKNSRRTIRRR